MPLALIEFLKKQWLWGNRNEWKKIISTNQAPAAAGPYSQGIELGNLIFVSGQLPIDPATGVLVEGLVEQTKQSISNVKAVLEAAGSSLDKVLKTTVFIRDMRDFAKVNEIYSQYFTDKAPARSCFAVAGLPKDALVEIECIAYK